MQSKNLIVRLPEDDKRRFAAHAARTRSRTMTAIVRRKLAPLLKKLKAEEEEAQKKAPGAKSARS